jgi:DNA-binding beta-propeller fold protein YncE/cytochrome oxidase Cu insertion factor (SCO1/SenC/PrrC family)
VCLALLCSLAGPGNASQKQGGKVFTPEGLQGTVNAPEFPAGLDWLNTSTPLRLKDLRGKFVLLDFWTFCCINCMHILPDLRKLETKYSQELVIIGVHSAKFQNEKDTSQIRDAILRYEIRHPVINDAALEVWQSYTVNAWPTIMLINPAGRIIGRLSGEGVYEPIDEVLSAAIPYFAGKGELKRSPAQFALEEARRANTLLSFPGKISADEKRNRLYVTDSNHNRVIVADADGHIADVIGGGSEGRKDGSFEEAEFLHPQGTFAVGDVLYIADTENHLIRAADLAARTVRTVLGTGAQASRLTGSGRGVQVALNSPWDLLVRDGRMYIAMAGAQQLWVADTKTWEALPYAGSGHENILDAKLLEASLAQPSGITTDGRRLYVADSETSSIREADLEPGGAVRTILGKGLFEFGDIDGGAQSARLQHPLGVAFSGGQIYVADTYNSKIKIVDPGKATVKTFAGSGKKALSDGKFGSAAFNEPGGLAWLGGKLYVADTNNHQIRVLDPATKSVSSLEFSGLEKLSRRQMDQFRGRVLDLGEHVVKAGPSELALNVVLPGGYKFNHDAPFFMRWTATDPVALKFTLQPEQVDFKKASFPLNVPVLLEGGGSEVTIDTVVYYCTSQSTVCYVDPIRVRLDLKASAAGPSVAVVAIPVKHPGAPTTR